MVLALLGDVHANDVALDTVLREVAAEGIDDVVCLGDVFTGGPRPRAVLETLADRAVTVVLGRDDAAVLAGEGPPADDGRLADPARIDRWCGEQLTDDERERAAGWPARVDLVTGGGLEVVCTHGARGARVPTDRPDAGFDVVLDEVDADVLAGGFTHEPMVRRHGGTVVVNPGSVGRPYGYRGGGTVAPGYAEYAVVSGDSGSLRAEVRRTPVPEAAVAAAVADSGMPAADWWLDGVGP
jgi:putative phosphoesterase